jgi:hypothetical protein
MLASDAVAVPGAALDTLELDFSPAVLTLPEAISAPVRRRPFHIGWFTPNREVNSASTRYRCFHMARALQDLGVRHSIFTDAGAIAGAMEQLDAVVIVKTSDGVLPRPRESRYTGTRDPRHS